MKFCSAAADPGLWSDGRAASDADRNHVQISLCLTGVFLFFMLSENLLKWKNTKLLETTDLLVILVYRKNI